ncbi:bifunctional UDP-N-acetylglucosamine diphosphorylase/glucosamine-1-phosphate N-acetyltransferase GlmU [soil metagenome]
MPLNGQLAVVVLTAGRGSRMRSSLPKILHPIAGLPMIEHIVRAVESLQPLQTIMVTGPTSEVLHAEYGERVQFAWQAEPLGTGHAVQAALPVLDPGAQWVMVVFGDHPLTDGATLQSLLHEVDNARPVVAMLAVELDDPGAYARFQMEDGRVTGLVEARDDHTVHDGPVTVNSGICCFSRAWLEEHLPQVPVSASGEIYLTSLIEVAAAEEHPNPVTLVLGEPEVAFGVNNRAELSEAERIIRRRINRQHMLAGVTLVDPDSTYIDADVEIGEDTRIEPGAIVRRGSRIGGGCVIGPAAVIEDSTIGDWVTVRSSFVQSSVIDDDADVGPYAHLRPGTRIASGVHIGNYVETKNATVGSGTHIGHFSYIGDAEIGSRVNVGAGTITCNFDGFQKHKTTVGDDVFIGSDTMLVAPVEVGEGARTGAGSVVTKPVPPGATVVGVPARLIRRSRGE